MGNDILLTIGGLLLLVIGAEGLVRGASGLAFRLGLTPLVIGLTVVAWGTSLPELLVSTVAALNDKGNVAAGNVVGSNIVNVCVILGVAAMICPIKVQFQLLRFDTPVMIGATLLAIWFFSDRSLDRDEGIVLLLLLVVYTTINVIMARRQTNAEVNQEFDDTVPKSGKRGVIFDILFVAAGLTALGFGSNWLVAGASGIARALGISEVVIGLTIVALGTSFPELVTSIVAALRKAPDIALGNVIGSNISNIFAILGGAAVISPFPASGITAIDLGVMLGCALLLIPILKTGLVVGRREGIVLVCVYVGYCAWLWPK